MSTTQATDYLGHPCKLTEARERFDDALATARKHATIEPRTTANAIGSGLLELTDRMSHLREALELLCGTLDNLPDGEQAHALAVMARDYTCSTADHAWELAGSVLLAVEKAEAHHA